MRCFCCWKFKFTGPYRDSNIQSPSNRSWISIMAKMANKSTCTGSGNGIIYRRINWLGHSVNACFFIDIKIGAHDDQKQDLFPGLIWLIITPWTCTNPCFIFLPVLRGAMGIHLRRLGSYFSQSADPLRPFHPPIAYTTPFNVATPANIKLKSIIFAFYYAFKHETVLVAWLNWVLYVMTTAGI